MADTPDDEVALDDDDYMTARREGDDVWVEVCGLDGILLRAGHQRRLVRFLLEAPAGANDLGALVEYWRSSTWLAQAPPGMVELAREHIAALVAEVHDLRARLETVRASRGDGKSGGQ